jgi:HAD superfamily hydrolase (TIGR01509 family)
MSKAILWDNDGVLVNSEILFYEANRLYFLRYGIDLSPERFFEWFMCSSTGAWHLLRAKGWDDKAISTGRRDRDDVYKGLLATVPDLTQPDIGKILQHFATKCRMAVVTSSDQQHFLQIHRKTNLLRHFELVVTASDYCQAKPHPEPYLVALDRLGLPPQACIAIEDSPRGLQAAIGARTPCVVIGSDLTANYSFQGAYAVVETIAQLGDVLHDWYAAHSLLTQLTPSGR